MDGYHPLTNRITGSNNELPKPKRPRKRERHMEWVRDQLCAECGGKRGHEPWCRHGFGSVKIHDRQSGNDPGEQISGLTVDGEKYSQ